MKRKSIPFKEFPEKYKLVIKGLRTARRGRKAYSEASIKGVISDTGQYFAAVQAVGLPLELSYDGIGAFVDNMDSRKLRNTTKLTYLSGVQAVAKATEYPSEQRRLILEDIAYYRSAVSGEVPTKHLKLAARPITLKDVAVAAVEFSHKARQAKNPNKRHTYLQRSAVLAFLSMMPLRISDVNRLTVGEHIKRDEAGWSLCIGSSKTEFRHSGPLHKNLTPYLDALITCGSEQGFWPEYALRRDTPLFGTLLNEPLSSRTLAIGFKTATGHGPHIVRTLVHDALAAYGDYGSIMAMVLCGQICSVTAKSYEVHAQRHRISRAQQQLTSIQDRILPA